MSNKHNVLTDAGWFSVKLFGRNDEVSIALNCVDAISSSVALDCNANETMTQTGRN